MSGSRALNPNTDWSIQFILELCSNCSHTPRSRKWWLSTHLAVLTWLTCGNASLDFTISTYTCTAQSWYRPFASSLAAPSKNTVFKKNVVHIYLIIVQSEKSTADWIIVIGHHPVYSSGSHGSEGSTQTMYDHIRSEMVKHKVALYVCGHDHMMEHLTDRS